MSLLEDIQAKADMNGDGKVSKEDLESLKDGANNEQLEGLKKIADQNGDGKIEFSDLKNIDMNNIGDQLKEKLGGLFGGK